DISIDGDIVYAIQGSGTATLILEAQNKIILKDDRYITRKDGNSGSLNLQLIANLDNDDTNGGNIEFGENSYIDTHGGDFVAIGFGFKVPTTAENPAILTGGGDITLTMTGAISLGSSIR